MKRIGLIISLLFLSITHTYAQKKQLTENDLVEHYGAIRKEMVLKACQYCNYSDNVILSRLDVTSVASFRDALNKDSKIYRTVASSAKSISGTDIQKYSYHYNRTQVE